MTIEDVHSGRYLIDWKSLSNCFRIARGRGISYRTLQGWRALKMPGTFKSGKSTLYCWPVIWEWYLRQFSG